MGGVSSFLNTVLLTLPIYRLSYTIFRLVSRTIYIILFSESILGAMCSEARFTNTKTGQMLSAMMLSSAEMQKSFPQFSSDCNQYQTATSKYVCLVLPNIDYN